MGYLRGTWSAKFRFIYCSIGHPMGAFESKFFYNLDLEASEGEPDSSLQVVFQNEMSMMSKDNNDYIRKLKEQVKRLDNMKH